MKTIELRDQIRNKIDPAWADDNVVKGVFCADMAVLLDQFINRKKVSRIPRGLKLLIEMIYIDDDCKLTKHNILLMVSSYCQLRKIYQDILAETEESPERIEEGNAN